MITLKTLTWHNLFSYGKGNSVDFSANPIVQLVGKNGHGKSSIALILEEVLYNKNSKGIKKADILNRYVSDKSYSIELTFLKDGDEYIIQTSRGSTQTVTLFKNGDNISAHTATATFKLIEEILGFDHKTFAQLIYQSSSASLEFLVATDTNRKKFLIDLLNLSKYVEAFETFKKLGKELELQLASIESKTKTIQTWLDKSLKEDLVEKPLPDIPVLDPKLQKELEENKVALLNIESTNKRVAANNVKIQQLNKIDPTDLAKQVQVDTQGKSSASLELGGHNKAVKDANAFISKIKGLKGTCPTCLQTIDEGKLSELIKEQEVIIAQSKEAAEKLQALLSKYAADEAEASRLGRIRTEWETLHNSIDKNLSSQIIDGDKLEQRIAELNKTITAINKQITAANQEATSVAAHNSKIRVILEQIDSMKTDLELGRKELATITEELSLVQILQKTFSTNGLIAYKIECLVKDLEGLANEYLADLSGGRFQLTFKISSGDKLNVIITDNGKDIDILALSGGERARVNTATLLAIRKLMQSLSNARVNLLVLDETIDSLDIDGKEKLVEVLLKEEHLNTFIISHGFTHPLLEKITVVKENNISRLE